MPLPIPNLIVCDFDGTITVEDVTNLIWDRHLAYDWRQRLLPGSRAGTITPLELMARGYGDIHVGPDRLLAELCPGREVNLRPGWEIFVRHCRERAWRLEVLSHGLPFYIHHVLTSAAAPPVSVTAFDAWFESGQWEVRLPAGVQLGPGEDFKSVMVRRFAETTPGHATIYIGDGRLDFPAARRCARIFAVRDSALDRLCREEAIPVTAFDSFHEVIAALRA